MCSGHTLNNVFKMEPFSFFHTTVLKKEEGQENESYKPKKSLRKWHKWNFYYDVHNTSFYLIFFYIYEGLCVESPEGRVTENFVLRPRLRKRTPSQKKKSHALDSEPD